MPAVLSQAMTQQELDDAMADIERAERARIFRECVGEGFCGFCQRQTLRVVWAGVFTLRCPCNFREPPP